MLICDILQESSSAIPEELNDQFINKLINSEFYKVNIKPALEPLEEKFDYLRNNPDGLEKEDIKELIDSYVFDAVDIVGNHLLFHGSHKIEGEVLFTKMQERKEPRDTVPFVHHYVNQLSKESLGVAIRNLLFVSNTRGVASNYGGQYVYLVFPLSPYTLFIHPEIDDFTDDLYVAQDRSFGASFTDRMLHELRDEFKKKGEDINNTLFSVMLRAPVDRVSHCKTFEEVEDMLLELIEEEVEKISDREVFDPKYYVEMAQEVIRENLKLRKKELQKYVKEIYSTDQAYRVNSGEGMINCEDMVFIRRRDIYLEHIIKKIFDI